MNKFFEVWNGLDFQARLSISAGVIFVFGMLIFISIFIFGSEYKTLYTGLENEETLAITKALDAQKIKYTLTDAGSTILVDEKNIDKTKILLAGEGVSLFNNVGFEIFDEADYGMTEFTQKVNYQRSLQGELERTIKKIQGVRSARVHLVLPEDKLFKNEKEVPKAAVNIHMKSGFELSTVQIEGVQTLVSSAVDNLESNAVTIFDQRGVLLSKTNDEEVEGINVRLSQKKELEAYLLKKATGILDKVYGPGVAMVNIDVQLDYAKSISKTELVIPSEIDKKQVVIKSKETRVKKQGTKVDSANEKVSPELINESKDIEFAFGKSIEEKQKLAGSIERMTVSILAPYDIEESDLESLTALVANTIGFDDARGDSISVTRVSLHKNNPDVLAGDNNLVTISSEQKIFQSPDLYQPIINNINLLVILLLVILIVIFLIFIFLFRSKLNKVEREQALSFIKKAVNENI